MRSLDNQILKLLSNNDVTFFIPPYQRNYEWGKEMCEILYKDIEKVADSEDTQHFFGTVIYYAESTILGQPDKYILVDGQQRLTTTMLFLIAAKDAITDEQLKNMIDSKYLKNNNVSGDVEYKIKLKQVESDWKAYKNIILGEHLDDADKKSNVFKNYKFFKSKLERLEQDKLKKLVEKGLVNFNIVTIQLEPERNHWEKPQEIFESMNSLGMPLSLADLVRNYLLLGKSSTQQNNLYHNFWLKIEQNLSGDNNAFSVSAFIRDYMQLINVASFKKATGTNHKELYREFKDLFEDDNHEELIKKLAEYSTDYAVLAGYQSSHNDKIDKKIVDLKIIESSGFYSFILGLLRLRTEEKIDDNGCLAILDAIFIYISRRRILRITQGENKNAPLLVEYFDDLISAENIKGKMLECLSNQQYALRLPNDKDISTYLLGIESNFYNLKSGKFLQSLIEGYLTKSRPNFDDKRLQVEHIMPQTLNDEWKNELGENYQQIYDDYINNIGNLTLIRHNPELGNNSFIDKKEVYENHAGMQIAKNKIIDQDNWGEEQIKNRAKYLVKMIINDILPISDELKTNNNYSFEKRRVGNRFSFEKIGLIGKEIVYFDDDLITAEVLSDKEVKFEDKVWRLSPLARELETRKNRRNKSGAYWGVDKWKYQGRRLDKWSQEVSDESEYDEDSQNE
ncbi:DUF262 domain-containing HNH endonuclease family protein [Candidatus Parcubacteria bacterium]|nr:DUF262 domain-containing HNH endonuclease family protein [Candidatus Parcubacteria bacterium]